MSISKKTAGQGCASLFDVGEAFHILIKKDKISFNPDLKFLTHFQQKELPHYDDDKFRRGLNISGKKEVMHLMGYTNR